MAAPPAGPDAVEWIDEPLGKGARAETLRRFRAGCLILAAAVLSVALAALVARWPQISVWVLLGLTAILLGLALRFYSAVLPQRLGLGKDGIVVIAAGGSERTVGYAQILGFAMAEGATSTARLRFRAGPGSTGAVRELMLDREVADRVLAKASGR